MSVGFVFVVSGRSYAACMRWNTNELAVLDVETTGLGGDRRILEVAVVIADADGDVVERFETLVNPLAAVGATHVHGLTAFDIVDAPCFGDVSLLLAKLLEGRVVVGHNLAFDWATIRKEFQPFGVEFPNWHGGWCTATLAARALGLPSRMLSLKRSCVAFGIEQAVEHAAMADAEATLAVLRAVSARISLPRARAINPIPSLWKLPRGGAGIRRGGATR